MATAQDIINSAYNAIGVATANISAAQSAKALTILNNMLGIWGIDGLLVPYRTSENFPLVVGQSSYTIGSGGNFNTVRPLEVVQAYIRDSSNIDYTLKPIDQRQYTEITNKTADRRPLRFYYDPQYTLGILYFDSEPIAVETLYLVSEKALTELAALSTTVALPDFYKEPLIYNLAIRIAIDETVTPDEATVALAAIGKNTIENYIGKNKLHRVAKMDSMLTHGNVKSSNIVTGT